MAETAPARNGTTPSGAAQYAIRRAYGPGAEHLVSVIQELSLARDLPAVQEVVRRAARALTRADGATFVLRDGDQCHYADEDAISPLWKGRRFPMSACISGWAMLHGRSVVIEDVFADPRIPADAYRPTFVRSLAMVPIRRAAPIGAIGNYWARRHTPSPEDLALLEALADSTSIAIENVQLCADLERRVAARTEELSIANQELESFAYSASHDLRAPLQAITGYSRMLLAGASDADRAALSEIHESSQRIEKLIASLLRLSQSANAELCAGRVDLTELARAAVRALEHAEPSRKVEFLIDEGLSAEGDPALLRALFDNLLGNAWKFTSRAPQPMVIVGRGPDGAFYVRDNGVGFDPAAAGRLFEAFERLHGRDEFPGCGIGLATVRRIVHRHGGRVWAEGRPGAGATFWFELP